MEPQVITTVTVPASTYDLTTLAIVKDELGITNSSSDTKLQRYLTSASAAASQYCNRVFPAETISEQFWGARDHLPFRSKIQNLQLSRWPVQSITSVTENAVTLVENTDFITDKSNGQLTRIDASGYPRMWPVYPIVVVYVGGFATIPTDVADAAIRMVKSRYNARSDSALKQETIPGVIERSWWIATGTESGNMTPDITDILDNYRVPIAA